PPIAGRRAACRFPPAGRCSSGQGRGGTRGAPENWAPHSAARRRRTGEIACGAIASATVRNGHVPLASRRRILPSPDMEFAPQQDEALKAVARWLKDGREPLFRLFGYAGTGKTTLARHFAENVDGEVLFAAFTGKAAQVLRSKGATNAKTIHSLIYRPRGEEEVSDEETGKTSISPM